MGRSGVDAGPLDELLERCTFPATGAVTCAVSGGADSMALLALAPAAGLDVTAVHVDHGLREGSAAEAAVVAAAAERLGAGFRAETVRVEQGPNLEARARSARYSVLPDGVLTGHTADDQAETVLLNLLRGAAVHGLSGMWPETRPLLGLRRAETRGVCARLGLEPVEDPSNADPRFQRNRVRHELVPLMNEIAGRDLVPVLARQAGHLRGIVGLLDELTAPLDPTDARALAEAPPVLAGLAVRDWLRRETGSEHPPDTAAVERVLAVARNEATATDVGGRWRVARTAQRLRIVAPSSGAPSPGS